MSTAITAICHLPHPTAPPPSLLLICAKNIILDNHSGRHANIPMPILERAQRAFAQRIAQCFPHAYYDHKSYYSGPYKGNYEGHANALFHSQRQGDIPDKKSISPKSHLDHTDLIVRKIYEDCLYDPQIFYNFLRLSHQCGTRFFLLWHREGLYAIRDFFKGDPRLLNIAVEYVLLMTNIEIKINLLINIAGNLQEQAFYYIRQGNSSPRCEEALEKATVLTICVSNNIKERSSNQKALYNLLKALLRTYNYLTNESNGNKIETILKAERLCRLFSNEKERYDAVKTLVTGFCDPLLFPTIDDPNAQISLDDETIDCLRTLENIIVRYGYYSILEEIAEVCIAANRLQEAERLCSNIHNNVLAKLSIVQSLMKKYLKTDNFAEVVKLASSLSFRGLPPDNYVYGIYIGYCLTTIDVLIEKQAFLEASNMTLFLPESIKFRQKKRIYQSYIQRRHTATAALV